MALVAKPSLLGSTMPGLGDGTILSWMAHLQEAGRPSSISSKDILGGRVEASKGWRGRPPHGWGMARKPALLATPPFPLPVGSTHCPGLQISYTTQVVQYKRRVLTNHSRSPLRLSPLVMIMAEGGGYASSDTSALLDHGGGLGALFPGVQ